MSVKQQSIPASFIVDDVKPATDPLTTVSGQKLLLAEFNGPIHNSQGCDHSFIPNVGYHPLVASVLTAFKGHFPLVLSPDIIWITIAQGIANHVNCNSETLRDSFVSHSGKQELVVQTVTLSSERDWSDAISRLVDKVNQNSNTDLAKLLKCRFSTTSAVEEIVQDLMVLNTFQKYFDYVIACVCGIPKVTLTGEVADWRLIVERLNQIPIELGLGWWIDQLLPLCHEFVSAAGGHPNQAHWQNICKPEDVYGGTQVNGWICRFIPYLKDVVDLPTVKNSAVENHEQGVTTNQFPRGLNSTPFTVIEDFNYYEFSLSGGLIGISQSSSNLAIEAKAGWLVQDGSDLRKTIKRILRNEGGSPPLAKDLVPPLEDAETFPVHLPGDYRLFYEEANGCEIGRVYRMLAYEELSVEKPPGWVPPEDDQLVHERAPCWTKLCVTNEGAYWLALDPVSIPNGSRVYPIYFAEHDLSTPIMVALELVEFLSRMENCPDALFHCDPTFEPILIKPKTTGISQERRDAIEKGLVSYLQSGNLNQKFTGIAGAYISIPEDLWILLAVSNGGSISTDCGDLEFLPVDECHQSRVSDWYHQEKLLRIGRLAGYWILMDSINGRIIALDSTVAENLKRKKCKGRLLAKSIGELLQDIDSGISEKLNGQTDWVTLAKR